MNFQWQVEAFDGALLQQTGSSGYLMTADIGIGLREPVAPSLIVSTMGTDEEGVLDIQLETSEVIL